MIHCVATIQLSVKVPEPRGGWTGGGAELGEGLNWVEAEPKGLN